jgi:hypothetical protein
MHMSAEFRERARARSLPRPRVDTRRAQGARPPHEPHSSRHGRIRGDATMVWPASRRTPAPLHVRLATPRRAGRRAPAPQSEHVQANRGGPGTGFRVTGPGASTVGGRAGPTGSCQWPGAGWASEDPVLRTRQARRPGRREGPGRRAGRVRRTGRCSGAAAGGRRRRRRRQTSGFFFWFGGQPEDVPR